MTIAQPHILVQQMLSMRTCALPKGFRDEQDSPLLFRSLMVMGERRDVPELSPEAERAGAYTVAPASATLSLQMGCL